MFLPDYFPSPISANPFFYRLVEKGILIQSDLFFAFYNTLETPVCDNAMLFLAFFAAMTREGHLYVSIKDNLLVPSTNNIIDDTSIIEGAKALPLSLKEKLFSIHNDCYYLHAHREAETTLLFHLDRLCKTSPNPLFYDFHSKDNNLTIEQATALNKALTSSFSIICGGPGTGKTFTATVFLKQFLKMQPNANITITALTGKATANLKKQTSSENVSAKTLHAFLQDTKDIQGIGVCNDDLIIVDESSMIDLLMMSALFSLVKTGGRILLLGDPNQLPPIGLGHPLEDIIFLYPNHTISLTTTLRTNIIFIKEMSTNILDGKIPSYKPLKTFNETVEDISNKFLSNDKNKAFSSFCVLTPLKKGLWGSDSLNKAIHTRLCEKTASAHKKYPIMITENRPEMNIFNGDCGVLHVDKKIITFENGKEISSELLSCFSYNYVTSIHKSQGSEYSEVLILLPRGCERFNKKLLYTAITRAKTHVEIHAIEGIPETIIQSSK